MSRVRTVVGMVVGAILLTLSAPAGAERSPIPARPNIMDPAGDANFTGRQHLSGPVQPSDSWDVLSAWFTSDARRLQVHVLTAGNPMDSPIGLNIQVIAADPSNDSDSSTCVIFGMTFPGQSGTGSRQRAVFRAFCPTQGPEIPIGLRVKELSDGSAISTMTIQKAVNPLFASGETLVHPRALVRHAIVPLGLTYVGGPIGVDITESGFSYKIP